MSHNYSHQQAPDSFDEFLAQLLANVEDASPPLPSLSSSFVSPSIGGPVPNFHPTCGWVLQQDPPLICGALLSSDSQEACAHFRYAHLVRGNEKVVVTCGWHECFAPPMLRGSLIRHLLSVHLGLLRWRCEECGRVFSRRGTTHACAEVAE